MKFGELFEDFAQSDNTPLSIEEKAQKIGLTVEQYAPVFDYQHRQIVVTAAAGSGKTKVLTHRVFELIKSGVAPSDILLCAFTKSAAEEMRHRLQKMGQPKSKLPRITTIHAQSLAEVKEIEGFKLVTEEHELYSLLDEFREFLPEELTELENEELLLTLNATREAMDSSSDRGISAMAWEEFLKEKGLVDFTCLVSQCAENDPPAKFKHILADEAQDLTNLQRKWISKHLKKGGTLFFVGDDMQSVYAFRGGATEVLKSIAATKDTKSYEISKNWRCDKKIVDLANKVSLDKNFRMKAQSTQEGFVGLKGCSSLQEEIDFCANLKEKHKSFIVLVRTNSQKAIFTWKGIPCLTMHQSKGMEFDTVVLSGLEAGIFPHPLSKLDDETKLLYVAITRARHNLLITSLPGRSINSREFKKEGQFLKNLKDLNSLTILA